MINHENGFLYDFPKQDTIVSSFNRSIAIAGPGTKTWEDYIVGEKTEELLMSAADVCKD